MNGEILSKAQLSASNGSLMVFALLLAVPISLFADDNLDQRTAEKLRTAMAGEHRAAENVARDHFRHPFETLGFFGLRDDMTVVELWPGGGWYTEILAPVLRDNGRYIAASFDLEHRPKWRANFERKFRAKLAEKPEVFDRVEFQPLWPPNKVTVAAPGTADMVLTFRNSHNWTKAGVEKAVYAAAYRALKPGGVLGVVQHRGEAGADPREPYIGYMDPAFLIKLIEGQGFKLVAQSEVNANLADHKNHPDGVWSLPPSYRGKSDQREQFAAIGESDRMTLKFIKP